MNPTDLIHPADWATRYLNYVREERVHRQNWRPGQINLSIADLEDRFDGLSEADVGAFIRIMFAYAEAPLINPAAGAKGPRRLTVERATRTLRIRGAHATRTLERLQQRGLLDFVPDQSRDEKTKTLNPKPLTSVAGGENHLPSNGRTFGRVDFIAPLRDQATEDRRPLLKVLTGEVA